MQSLDFFRCRIDSMIDLRDPLAVLAQRLPWGQIEGALAPKFKRKERAGQCIAGQDLWGPTQQVVGAGVSRAGRPKLPIRQCERGRPEGDVISGLVQAAASQQRKQDRDATPALVR